MLKIVCDRCGVEIKKEGNENELRYTKKRNTRYGYDKLINLCSHCMDDFKKFIMEKK